MDYKERYNTALEMAREAFYSPETPHFAKAWLLTLFPTIAESEDESIKKEIIAIFKGQIPYTSEEDAKKYIAWLEKQGKKPQGKSVLDVWKDMRLEVYLQASGNRHESNYSDDRTKMFSLEDIDEIIEKINEQKLL